MPIYQASIYHRNGQKYLQIREDVNELQGEMVEPIKTRHKLNDIHQIREIAENLGCRNIDLLTNDVCKQIKIKF